MKALNISVVNRKPEWNPLRFGKCSIVNFRECSTVKVRESLRLRFCSSNVQPLRLGSLTIKVLGSLTVKVPES